MKTKTRTLTGRALAYAVALAEGYTMSRIHGKGASKFDGFVVALPNGGFQQYIMDTDATRAERKLCEDYPFYDNQRYWQPTYTSQGDDIIDREKIATSPTNEFGLRDGHEAWTATLACPNVAFGITRREAAMRVWVIFKLGEKIDIPKELL